MGFFTWRAAKGTQNQVRALRRQTAMQAAIAASPFRLETSTPEEAVRLRELGRRRKDLFAALEREGVRKVRPGLLAASAGGNAWLGRDVDAVRAAVRLVVCEGSTIDEAAREVGEASRSVAL